MPLAARVGDPLTHPGSMIGGPGAIKVLIVGQPAARVGDPTICPVIEPPAQKHVPGPILPPGSIKVKIMNQPAARQGDQAVCAPGGPNLIAAPLQFKVIIG